MLILDSLIVHIFCCWLLLSQKIMSCTEFIFTRSICHVEANISAVKKYFMICLLINSIPKSYNPLCLEENPEYNQLTYLSFKFYRLFFLKAFDFHYSYIHKFTMYLRYIRIFPFFFDFFSTLSEVGSQITLSEKD